MPELKNLVKDIQGVLTNPPEITQEQADELGKTVSRVIREKMSHQQDAKLRMSNLGSKCLRQLWYKVNAPETAEPLPASARLKFMYGDVIEALVIWLAKLAGHKVEGEQDTLEINGVIGHRDAKIDGITVDVKSASTLSFKKFEEGLKPHEDAFGYLDQLGAYVYADKDPEKSQDGAFIAIDKTLGHITLDVHKAIGNKDYGKLVNEKRAAVNSSEVPARAYFAEEDGKSGNLKLGVKCSYCEFKRHCWPGLRTFAYSNGPRYLVRVVREPDVPELK